MLKIKHIAKNEPYFEPNLAPLVLSNALNINVLSVSKRSQERTQYASVIGCKWLNLREAWSRNASKRTQPLAGPKKASRLRRARPFWTAVPAKGSSPNRSGASWLDYFR